tara:strand:+ start:133 stop:339 length:207 start_codon:yes stop_codon:yes gene_type:complete
LLLAQHELLQSHTPHWLVAMIQFREDDIHQLIRACNSYQKETGSEFVWDEYEKLKFKLEAYQKEITTD